jgi:phosphoglycerate dehydrogenase-like enzyme
MEQVIASQLDAQGNAYLREVLPDLRVVDLPFGPPGLDQIPPNACTLIVQPINTGGVERKEPPRGWPWSLKWVQLVTSGIDFYPRWLFEVPQVASAKGAMAGQVAEFALATIFCAAKQLPELWVKDDNWRLSPLQTVEGATLGILGFGLIGQALARKALALGMRVIALGRPGQAIAELAGIETAADIYDLFSQSDHLVVAAPLTEQTRHLLDRSVLSSAKPGLHLINLARGGLLDHEALLTALDSGWLARASLDVTEPEPLPKDHPLYRHPQVRISPHTSAVSAHSKRRLIEAFAANHQRFLANVPLENLVDIRRGY